MYYSAMKSHYTRDKTENLRSMSPYLSWAKHRNDIISACVLFFSVAVIYKLQTKKFTSDAQNFARICHCQVLLTYSEL